MSAIILTHNWTRQNVPVRKWEHFSTVCEWYRTFSRRVEGSKQVDEQSNSTESSIASRGWNQEAETCSQERPRHLREGEEQQGSASKRVNSPDRWPGEDEVDQSESERGNEGVAFRSISLSENSRTVKGDYVDPAHLQGLVLAAITIITLATKTERTCCAIITTKLARVARRTRGIVNS